MDHARERERELSLTLSDVRAACLWLLPVIRCCCWPLDIGAATHIATIPYISIITLTPTLTLLVSIHATYVA